MDDLSREMKADEEFKDVVVWTVLGKNRERKLAEMVGKRGLPVLRDTDDIGFQQLYGINSSRTFLIFNRRGCLGPTKIKYGADIMRDPKMLLPILREG